MNIVNWDQITYETEPSQKVYLSKRCSHCSLLIIYIILIITNCNNIIYDKNLRNHAMVACPPQSEIECDLKKCCLVEQKHYS